MISAIAVAVVGVGGMLATLALAAFAGVPGHLGAAAFCTVLFLSQGGSFRVVLSVASRGRIERHLGLVGALIELMAVAVAAQLMGLSWDVIPLLAIALTLGVAINGTFADRLNRRISARPEPVQLPDLSTLDPDELVAFVERIEASPKHSRYVIGPQDR